MSEVVSSFIRGITITPTVSTAPAYSANDQVGGIQTLTSAALQNNATATLLTLVVVDQAHQVAPLTVFFFDSLPTVASSDNAALNISDAVMAANCIGAVTIAVGDYQSTSANSVATIKAGATGLYLKSATLLGTLYAVVMTTGTPTYVSTTDLVFKYIFSQDL